MKLGKQLLDAQDIAAAVGGVAWKLPWYCANKGITHLTVVPVLNGAMYFAADLTRQLDPLSRGELDVDVQPVCVSSYKGTSAAAAKPYFTHPPPNLRERDVLLVEDILDTGHTLRFLKSSALLYGARSVALAVMLDKERPETRDVLTLFGAAFVGCRIPDVFVVGYGLDYDRKYRNLPAVYAMEPAAA